MGDRILGAICLVVAVAMGWAAQGYAAEISYEPVGPRAFPLLLAVVMGGVGIWLLVKRTAAANAGGITPTPVSYTHLDVYKRQAYAWATNGVEFDLRRGAHLFDVGSIKRCQRAPQAMADTVNCLQVFVGI